MSTNNKGFGRELFDLECHYSLSKFTNFPVWVQCIIWHETTIRQYNLCSLDRSKITLCVQYDLYVYYPQNQSSVNISPKVPAAAFVCYGSKPQGVNTYRQAGFLRVQTKHAKCQM